MNFVLFIRKVPVFGIYIVMFLSILKTFFKFFVVFQIFITAFGFSFYVLLQDSDVSLSFILYSLIQTYVKGSLWDVIPIDFSLHY
jgi:hypothetical protein